LGAVQVVWTQLVPAQDCTVFVLTQLGADEPVHATQLPF
jgi:hypothetical protein